MSKKLPTAENLQEIIKPTPEKASMIMTKISSKVRDDGYYYDLKNDLDAFPDAWLYIIFGGRNTGKTYSALRRAVENNKKFIFLKRTKHDMEMLCVGGSKKARELGIDVDTSPFVSLNRDFGWNIKAFLLDDLGVFCHCDKDGMPLHGIPPVGYIMALSIVDNYKGYDMSYVDWIIFDEFVPKKWSRKKKDEGDSVMEIYKTVSRDREHRGAEALKLIALANADNAASPLTETVEVTDDVVEMALQKEATFYNTERDLVLRRLIDNKEFKKKEAQSKIYKTMAGTKWAAMALDNDFGYNDFSQVQKFNLKGSKPLCKVLYKNSTYYLYVNDKGVYCFTDKQFNTSSDVYDLDKEADQIRFFYDWITTLQEAASEHRCVFGKYTLSRIVYEYRNNFKIRG